MPFPEGLGTSLMLATQHSASLRPGLDYDLRFADPPLLLWIEVGGSLPPTLSATAADRMGYPSFFY